MRAFAYIFKIKEFLMDKLIAVCGLDCAECEGYQATQANDEAAKERVVARWAAMYNAPGLTVAGVTCDGCTMPGRKGAHCGECEIRLCGIGRGLANCAHCAEFETCAKLAGFFSFAPQAKITLQEIHKTYLLNNPG